MSGDKVKGVNVLPAAIRLVDHRQGAIVRKCGQTSAAGASPVMGNGETTRAWGFVVTPDPMTGDASAGLVCPKF